MNYNPLEEWAANEVRMAINRLDSTEEVNDQIKAYNLGLDAYRSLCQSPDYLLSKVIFEKLQNYEPLTPINDIPGEWNEVSRHGSVEEGYKLYQNIRRSSLFKKVYNATGDATYDDVESITAYTADNPNASIGSSLVRTIIGQMYPIAMPYTPIKRRVLIEEFLYDQNNGDFDTVGILFVTSNVNPDQTIFRYFKESETNGWDEITVDEYDERKDKYNERINRNNND